MTTIKVDIIGAGFGGLSAAISIKEIAPTIDVIIHEKYSQIGYNPDGRRCGEAHNLKGEWTKWKPTHKSIFNTITKGELFSGDAKLCFHEKKDTAFILNRPEFLSELGKKAEQLGVRIQTDDPIDSISNLDGTYIIDASGSRNQFKRELGLKRGLNGISYQETIQDPNHFIPDTIQIFWLEQNGYYWIFPRNPENKEINVGIGFFGRKKKNLQKHLEKFKKDQGIKGEVTYVTGGIIPFGLQRPFKYKNILFVGDTAVGTFPLSGQGIYRALISGDIAGKCIAKGFPERYPSMIDHAFISREEVIGKTFLLIIEMLKRVNPCIILKIAPILFNISNSVSRYSQHIKRK